MKQQETTRYYQNPDFVLREIGGEALLVPLGSSELFDNSVITLNDTWTFLWKALAEPRTAAEVIELTKQAYEAPPGAIEVSVNSFVKQCSEYGLLKEEKGKE